MATQLDKGKALLRPVHVAIKAFNAQELHDLLAINRKVLTKPDNSITREAWALLDKAHDALVELRSVLNTLNLDE